jgi:hypothetical protein
MDVQQRGTLARGNHREMTRDLSQLVITHETRPSAALQFIVNFGIFTGREATRHEIKRLSNQLLAILAEVTIFSEERFEATEQSLAEIHQVRVEIDRLPPGQEDVETLRIQLAAAITHWAAGCIDGFSGAELTDAELDARDAVIETD